MQEAIWGGVIGGLATGIIAWLTASVTKVSRKDYDKLVDLVTGLNAQIGQCITRAELQSFIETLRLEIRQDIADIRTDIRSLRR